MNYEARAGCKNGTVCMRVKEKFRTENFKRNGVYPLEKKVVSIFIHVGIITTRDRFLRTYFFYKQASKIYYLLSPLQFSAHFYEPK